MNGNNRCLGKCSLSVRIIRSWDQQCDSEKGLRMTLFPGASPGTWFSSPIFCKIRARIYCMISMIRAGDALDSSKLNSQDEQASCLKCLSWGKFYRKGLC